VLTQSADQLPDLPRRQPESFGRAPRLELAVRHVLNDLEPVQLAHRHRDPFRCSHRSLQRWIPSGRSAYDGSKSGHLNFARSGHYNLAATITKFDHVNYVKFNCYSPPYLGGSRAMLRTIPTLAGHAL